MERSYYYVFLINGQTGIILGITTNNGGIRCKSVDGSGNRSSNKIHQLTSILEKKNQSSNPTLFNPIINVRPPKQALNLRLRLTICINVDCQKHLNKNCVKIKTK